MNYVFHIICKSLIFSQFHFLKNIKKWKKMEENGKTGQWMSKNIPKSLILYPFDHSEIWGIDHPKIWGD